MLTAQEEHIEKIRAEFGVSEGTRSREVLQNLLKFVAEDVNKDKYHFIFELIQNADDCTFPEGATPPFMEIYVSGKAVVSRVNECGFMKKDVDSLCHAGNSQKQDCHETTGEKGLGFKSVFQYSNKPHVVSGGYQFFFEDDGDLGHVRPTWFSSLEELPNYARKVCGECTVIYLPAREQHRNTPCTHEEGIIKEITAASLSLLFLRRIQKLKLLRPDDPRDKGTIIQILRGTDEHEYAIVPLSNSDEEAKKQQGPIKSRVFWTEIKTTYGEGINTIYSSSLFFVIEKAQINVPKEKRTKRRERETTLIQLAFPVSETGEAIEPERSKADVYARLPIRHYGFSFIIEADWLLAGSREEIHDDPLN